MTVLTFPPVGGKSDKAPLIGDAEVRPGQTQPPPPYNPKFLETGDGGVANTNNNDDGSGGPVKICDHRSPDYRRLIEKICRFTVLLLGVLLILYFGFDTLCKSYIQEIQHRQLQEAEDDASVPCKSYSSYAAAESDMLSLPSSPEPEAKDLVISLVINPVEANVNKVPHIVINKSARYLHDFSVNITGIIDFENQRCYVMPLLRSTVEPPGSLYDMLIKMSTGYYSLDMDKILSNFQMIKPAINDLSDYGLYISKDCADYQTFKLQSVVITEPPNVAD
ncbi:uncharacterized protein LOC112593165 [Melanaphis sacchari]|uniref:Integral membrane protein 2 n=1 Tax=Melanaphis sacchari TaxID=742174 RepID=A0A2H8TNI7_9HEMI|nr:uncharacterized protein LOC112593165 [Melanaphis sacchari]